MDSVYVAFVDFIPGSIIYCQKTFEQILIANQKIIFSHSGLVINVGDGVFSVIYDNKTYLVECYGQKLRSFQLTIITASPGKFHLRYGRQAMAGSVS